jgi:glycosyltransferase involved in cell wall biosynthesis
MRVLLLGPYPPPHGGVQTNLVAIREMLLAQGIPCSVINLHRHRTGRGQAVYHPTGALETLWLLLRLRYDTLHLHLGGDLTPRLLGLCLACTLIPGKKAVLTFHSGGYASSPAGRSAAPGTLRGRVFRRFDRIIAVNHELVELFHRFGVPPERVRLIPPHALPPRAPDVELPPRLCHFFRTHRPVLLTVGLLEPEYDLPLQVRALGRIRERRPKAGLVLIGSGSLEPRLRGLIEQQPYAEHILLCGDVPHAATLRAIAEADVCLRTTLYDGDSVAVRESLHLGTPVIASDNRMRPAGVRLIPASDLDALCEAIEAALASPRPRGAASISGDEHIRAVLDLYRGLRRRGAVRVATHRAVE